MIVIVPNVFTKIQCQSARYDISKAQFVDGKTTAGDGAKLVKNNEQAVSHGRMSDLQRSITRACYENVLFSLAARQKDMDVIISRYRPGHAYGTHVDNVVMSVDVGTPRTKLVRRDLSFTLFLSEPDTYDGGELVMELPQGEQAFKLPAGDLVLYQTTPLHRVNEVTRGERLAAVGWIRSYIRDPSKRELLMDLDFAQAKLTERHGESDESRLLAKSTMNLMRMWLED